MIAIEIFAISLPISHPFHTTFLGGNTIFYNWIRLLFLNLVLAKFLAFISNGFQIWH